MSKNNNSLLPPLWILTIVMIVALIWLLVTLKEIVTLLIVGFVISYVIEPLIEKLEKLKIPRVFAFFIVLISFLVIISVLALTTWPTLSREASNLITNLPNYVETAKERLTVLLSNFGADSPIHTLLSKPLESLKEFGQNIVPKILEGLKSVLLGGYSATLAILNLALLPFIVYYLSVSFPSLDDDFLALVPKPNRSKARQILTEIDSYVSAFVRGQLLVCTVLFFLYSIGLGVLGVELWLVLAVIAGFGNLIPYLGTVLGIVLASIMAIVTFGDFWHVLYTWIVFAIVQFLEGTIITPRIIGDSLGLSPLTVILSLVAGGTLFGLLGIFLAVPVAAILKVLLKHGRLWLVKQMA
jgi:predicted PurR-regulated permease PerM